MLTSLISFIYQRTGNFNLLSNSGLEQFKQAVITDLAAIANQLNSVYKPLVSNLAEDVSDPITNGISANNLYADIEATVSSKSVFYSQEAERNTTVKEALEILLARIEALENA